MKQKFILTIQQHWEKEKQKNKIQKTQQFFQPINPKKKKILLLKTQTFFVFHLICFFGVKNRLPYKTTFQALTSVFLLGSNTNLIRDSLIDINSGNSVFNLVASSSLLLLGATITLACSSNVKFFQVKLGSM